jgi:phosphopantothenate synthetase
MGPSQGCLLLGDKHQKMAKVIIRAAVTRSRLQMNPVVPIKGIAVEYANSDCAPFDNPSTGSGRGRSRASGL